MRNHRVLSTILLLFILVSCAPAAELSTKPSISSSTATTIRADTSTPSATLPSIANRTATHAATATLIPPTRTVVPASPSPTLTPTPAPLLANGPWLLLEKQNEYMVSDLNGDNVQPVNLPALPEDRRWFNLSKPAGPFLAFRTTPKDSVLVGADIRRDGLDDQVWIVKLPENKVIQHLPLLSDATWRAALEKQAQNKDSYDPTYNIPPALGLITNPYSFLWSPRGRYLTYTASIDGDGVDLYMYDTVKNTSRRLTHGRTGAQVWFWSPDGKTVVYKNGTATSFVYGYADLIDPEIYALGQFVNDRRLYKPQMEEEVVKVTEQDFIVNERCFECDRTSLRRVNFNTGEIETLFKERFTDFAADSTGQVLILSFDPEMSFSGSFIANPGVYRLDRDAGKLIYWMEGSTVNFLPSLNRFYATRRSGEQSSDALLFNPSGKIKLVVKDTNQITLSPDGQWLLVGMDRSWRIIKPNGEQVADFTEVSDLEWLPDSSGLLSHGCSCGDSGLTLYRRDNNWQPEPLPGTECDNFIIVPGAE